MSVTHSIVHSSPGTSPGTSSGSSSGTFYLCIQSISGNFSCQKKDSPVPPVDTAPSRLVSVPSFIPPFLHKSYIWVSLAPSLPKIY